MSAGDLLKMDVSRILKGEKKDEAGTPYNDKITKGLQRSIQKLPDSGSYVAKVVLLGNAKAFTSAQVKKLVHGYEVEQFPHDRFYQELLFPLVNGTYFSDPNLTIEINLANLKGDSHLDYDVKAKNIKANTKLLFVPTREVGRIMSRYRNSILRFNPRSFLELQNNVVNQAIEASIKEEESNAFALFNNGLTIICDQTAISSNTAKQGTAQVVMRNPQLVNGGQTAYTLGRIYDECTKTGDFAVFKGKEVLLRLITFVGSQKGSVDPHRLQLVGDISKASNSQTKVDESDRRSNDLIQLSLQKTFFIHHGLYYERKRGEFSDGLQANYISSELLVNREKLVRVALAADFSVNLARSSVTKFFSKSSLPQLLKTKDVDKYVYGYEVDRLLEVTKKGKPKVKGDRFHTHDYGQGIRYGRYAVVAACVNRAMPKKKSEQDAAVLILKQWKQFEIWASTQTANKPYLNNGAFDFVNYYKGATINSDVQKFAFVV
jgi:AIPR protein